MSIQVLPSDFQPCFRCGVPVLLVGYWDEKKGAVGEIWVDSTFEYQFLERDYKNRLVVHDLDPAMASRHDVTCMKIPSPEDNGDTEPPPYQRLRSKRK